MHPYPRMFSGEPASALVERVQWTFPIVFSPVDPNVLFTATQHVWKTTNDGQDWTRISGDLTRHDPKTLGHSGGPITGDMNGPEVYATVFALAPSKVDVNVLWAGSDDGMIHVTRNGGKTWANVTPKDMPEFGRVSIIDASAFDAGTAYAAVKRPLLGDHAPYLFRTHDFGKTWTKIVERPRSRTTTRTPIREDHKRAEHALRRHAARHLLLVRRRRHVALAVAEPAGRADLGHLGRRHGPGDRDARPVVLRARRHRPAAAVRAPVRLGDRRRSCSRRTMRSGRTARRHDPVLGQDSPRRT